METKQIYCDHSSSPSTKYESFIARMHESFNESRYKLPRWSRVRACFHGWVILSNDYAQVHWSIWNPLTSKVIHLPTLTRNRKHFYTCCLSSPPDAQGSVLLLLPEGMATIVYCRLDRERELLKWAEVSYAKQLLSISRVESYLYYPTCCNGKVYALTMKPTGFVIELDIVVKGTEVLINLLPVVKVPHASCTSFPTRNSFYCTYGLLKGSCSDLFYIEVSLKDETRISGVNMFKLDMTSMTWKKIEDLKDALFFVKLSTPSILFYKSEVSSEVGGYVHILDDSNKITYSFYAKDKTMSLSLMPCTSRESHVLVWAMLECRLDDDHHEFKQEEKDKDIEIVRRPVKPDQTEINSTKLTVSHLLNVPSHILEKIMQRCLVVEYMQFRATCKYCYFAAPLIQWRNTMTSNRVVSPWLMVFESYQGIISFTDPIYGDRYFMKTPQELKGDCRIKCSRNGWLLLNAFPPQLWFFNPFTRNIRKLPAMPCCLKSLCFSTPPTSPNCMVVGFTKDYVYIHFVSQEQQQPSWRRYDLNFVRNDIHSYPIPTFIGRDMYVMFNKETVVAFRDLGKEDFSTAIVAKKAPRRRCTSLVDYYLSYCDEHLLLVIVGESGESVEVFKLNDSTKEWEKINGIGKHMIYISDTSCICLEAKSPEMENKIYFPRILHNEDTKIVFYSLETCMYHTLDEKNIQESSGVILSDTKQHCYHHSWIEPSWA